MPETLHGNFKFFKSVFTRHSIIKTDSCGNTQILSSGSHDQMKSKYLKHNYTTLDGYYIVEVLSTIQRVVK